MNNLLVICGPTATGKTSLGIRLAKKFEGEIVSADSRQVYRGMDIGTGKDLPVNSKFQMLASRDSFGMPNSKQISNFKFQTDTKYQILNTKYQIGYHLFDEVKIWLLDVVKPDYRFTAADYVSCASLVINHLWKNKKLPILVGGTGFYIKALLEGIATLGIPPNWRLRKKLESKSLETLREKIKALSPQRWRKMNPDDRKNPHRLIRAIEIAQNQSNKTINHQSLIINHLFIGLTAPSKILYPQIDQRVEKRVRQGIAKEIEGLLKGGYSWKNSVLGETIGYQEFQPFFADQETLSEAVQKWKYAEHAYARRQMTWFKKAFPDQKTWFDITQKGFIREIEKRVKNWLKG